MDTRHHHQLTRSETNKRIAGVCGGIAEYFDVDPVLVRVAFVLAALFGGPGLLIYVVLWIVLPKGDPSQAPVRRPGGSSGFGQSNAIRIAEERFARGDIDADELYQIRRDLGAV